MTNANNTIMTNEVKTMQWGEGSVTALQNGKFRFTFRKVTRTGKVANNDYLIHSGIAQTAQDAWKSCEIHNNQTFFQGKQNKAY